MMKYTDVKYNYHMTSKYSDCIRTSKCKWWVKQSHNSQQTSKGRNLL